MRILGSHAYGAQDGRASGNRPASRFVRPNAGRLARFHPLHRRTIMAGMTRAAQAGKGYHLWWHPHNFGRDTEANLAGLAEIIGHFTRLRDSYGMVSRSMAGRAS